VVGKNIRAKRKRARLTLEVLAEKANLHPNYLGRVERAEENISLAALIRIAKALGVHAQVLLTGV
jgi:transcriptional regulator with XRE-family HTH domain